MARNMVGTYLHFRILKFPLIILEHPFKIDDLGVPLGPGNPHMLWAIPPHHSQDPLDLLQWQTYRKTEQFGFLVDLGMSENGVYPQL